MICTFGRSDGIPLYSCVDYDDPISHTPRRTRLLAISPAIQAKIGLTDTKGVEAGPMRSSGRTILLLLKLAGSKQASTYGRSIISVPGFLQERKGRESHRSIEIV